MIDFHSHVLPAMDDGAKDAEASLAMLHMAAAQGARAVAATPHFYWGQDTVDSFLARRRESLAVLHSRLTAECPPVLPGSEVLLREGISRLELRPLCLQGTEVLLVELPFSRPPHWLLEELENIVLGQRLTVMLAHLDRYAPWYSRQAVTALTELPEVIVQLNAGALADGRRLRALRKWLPTPDRLVLGSDMHSPTERAPQLDRARARLSRSRAGRLWLAQMAQTTQEILCSTEE